MGDSVPSWAWDSTGRAAVERALSPCERGPACSSPAVDTAAAGAAENGTWLPKSAVALVQTVHCWRGCLIAPQPFFAHSFTPASLVPMVLAIHMRQ